MGSGGVEMANIYSMADEMVNNPQARMQADYAMNFGSDTSTKTNGDTFHLIVERDGVSEVYDIDAANEKEAAKIAEKSFIKKYGKNLLKKCKVSRK